MSAIPTDEQLDSLAAQVGRLAHAKHHMIVTAESCTAGWVAKTLTDMAGSSAWFESGVAVYSYEAKQALLGVRPETLEVFGAVSQETVLEMVSGAIAKSGGTLAVAVTGIAGPGGGTADKPVGTVWLAWKQRGGYPLARVYSFEGNRDAVRRQAVQTALNGLLETLQSN